MPISEKTETDLYREARISEALTHMFARRAQLGENRIEIGEASIHVYDDGMMQLYVPNPCDPHNPFCDELIGYKGETQKQLTALLIQKCVESIVGDNISYDYPAIKI